jgi:hypothetical protein
MARSGDGQERPRGRGYRRAANAALAAGLVLTAAAAGWWQADMRGLEIANGPPLPAFDPRALWIAGGLTLLAAALRLLAPRPPRPVVIEPAGAANAAAASPGDAGREAGASRSALEPDAPLETVFQEATGLGLKVHTTGAGYVLRDTDGRELVYADPRLLASAVRRHVAG